MNKDTTGNLWQQIADFFNALIGALQSLAKLQKLQNDPIGALTGQSVPNVPQDTQQGGKPTSTGRCHITDIENITARFNDTGSPAWANNPGGRHLGTDFGAPYGSNVYAAYSMQIVAVGSYSDPARMGTYVIGDLADGTEYYSGHLQNVTAKAGDYVKCGDRIGQTNVYNHTHIQMKSSGQLIDPEAYFKSHP